NNLLFQSLSAEQQLTVVNTMWLRELKANETIIKQGDLGDHWYVVESGHFDIFVAKPAAAPVKVAARDRGSSFGELALLYNSPRAATVTATVASSVWTLDRWTFR